MSTVKRNIFKLKQLNILERVGPKKNGQWKFAVSEAQNDPINDPESEPINDPLNEPINDLLNDPIKLTKLQSEIAAAVQEEGVVTYDELAVILGKSVSTVKRNIFKLKQLNILERVGPKKNGQWKLVLDEAQNDPKNEPINEPINDPINDPLNDPINC